MNLKKNDRTVQTRLFKEDTTVSISKQFSKSLVDTGGYLRKHYGPKPTFCSSDLVYAQAGVPEYRELIYAAIFPLIANLTKQIYTDDEIEADDVFQDLYLAFTDDIIKKFDLVANAKDTVQCFASFTKASLTNRFRDCFKAAFSRHEHRASLPQQRDDWNGNTKEMTIETCLEDPTVSEDITVEKIYANTVVAKQLQTIHNWLQHPKELAKMGLSPQEQKIVLLTAKNLNGKQLASALGCSRQNVYKIRKRAMEKLRNYFPK